MFTQKLYDNGETIYRVLAENEDELLVIDCIKRTMPFLDEVRKHYVVQRN